MLSLLLLFVTVSLSLAAASFRTPFGPSKTKPLVFASGHVVNVATHPKPVDRRSPRPLGWIADAVYTAPRRSRSFGGSWVVPPLPAKNDGQTLYLFTGIQPTFSGPLVIAQPVLAYQQNQGEAWTLASWFCCDAGHSTPISASPGDRISGIIDYSPGQWKIVTMNLNTGKSTTLLVNTTEILNQYYVTLETYGIQQCSDYPTGSTTFKNLTAFDANGRVNLQWSIQQQDPTCRETALVQSKDIEIKYHT